MKKIFLGLLVVRAFTVTTAFADGKTYSCNDLDHLRSRVSKDETLADASVAAQLIRSLAQHSDACMKTMRSTKNSIEVQYLDKANVVADAFLFSEKNFLVSWTRTFKNGQKESAHF